MSVSTEGRLEGVSGSIIWGSNEEEEGERGENILERR